ncbi:MULTISPECIES: hypothetical protein [Streptacidiphilus]|uniref:Integral membrane protein n=1 Tax=Streptacidiphilus cavernicola TaxID=3342716 RepID=A0ABV6UFI6_9ACTN|nr:hypothetical protein [Streptacidiphilus jeojiense]
MNPRTVTRGDAALAAAALLLLISSFLPYYSADCGSTGSCTANAWHGSFFPLLPAVFFLGVIGAALVLVGRLAPQAPKVAGIELAHWGTVLTVASLWSSLWSLFSTPSPLLSHSFGAYLGFLFALLTAGAAIATPLLPALAAPLTAASPTGPQQMTGPGGYPTYGQPGQPGQVGHPGQPGQQPYQPQPAQQFHHGQPVQQAQPGQPFSGPVAPAPGPNPAQAYQPQPSGYGYPQPAAAAAPAPAPSPAPAPAPAPAATPQDAPPREREDSATALLTPVVKPQSSAAAEEQAAAETPAAAAAAGAAAQPHSLEKGAEQPEPAPAAENPAAPAFAPFWFAVPAPRSLAPEGDSGGPSVGELVPGTWYLAIAQRGDALLTQTQEGKRGLLSDTSGIQRG